MSTGNDHPRAPKIGIVAWLAIVVVVSIAAAIIIPNFLPPGRPSGPSESKSNLGAIRSTEVAYFAEWGFYVGGQTLTPVADRRHRPNKAPWDRNTRFSILGFAPEGDVYYSYSLEGPVWSKEGFTATAVADLDDDGEVSVYTIRDADNVIMHSSAH